MNFVHPLIEKAISIDEGETVTLVIENAIALRNTVNGISNSSSEFVLSENFAPVEFSKYAEIVTDMFNIDFASKKISAKLAAEAEQISNDYPDETMALLNSLNNYAELILESFDVPVKFSLIESVEKLIKLMNFGIDDDMQFPEALLTYMGLCRCFFGKRLFVFLNLKSIMSDNEFELFCKNVSYEGFCVLLLEAFDSGKTSECEKKIIIDNDLCIISNSNF